ncbi:MAG: hypothetical protein GX612_05065 [Bacteroidales bacterium]|jgi:hypothetical protein|nr:hypothetical protein [Bacteroidales bacterium]
MKKSFWIILLCFVTTVNAQNKLRIKMLSSSLDYYKHLHDKHFFEKKGKAYRLLSIDKYNIYAIEYLIRFYQHEETLDSVNCFFQDLINNNPQEVEPYLIRDYLWDYNYRNTFERIRRLKMAWLIDSNHYDINVNIGKIYYDLFNKEHLDNKNKTEIDYYAKQAYFYLSRGCVIDTTKIEELKYPIIQLASYLEDTTAYQKLKSMKSTYDYFPLSAFMHLPIDWETNFKINVIDCQTFKQRAFLGIKNAVGTKSYYTSILQRFNEKALKNINEDIFRFLWLRTFHHPIVIVIKKQKNRVKLYWKVLSGQSGYRIGKCYIKGCKYFPLSIWTSFLQQLDSINYWNLRSCNINYGYDGSNWILEGKINGNYWIVDRWTGGEIQAVCKQLIKMTDIKIKPSKIY